ncbi:MAG: hypothetical protein KTR32_19520 [Granulosicoccus sp.]|nr:hypothetical protein [Granulosicoccus sp.]
MGNTNRKQNILIWRGSAALLAWLLVSVGSVAASTLLDGVPLEVEGYAKAPPGLSEQAAWPYDFPADHLAHDAYRSELWQIFLYLQNEAGQSYGLTGRIARIALAPPLSASAMTTNSPWAFSGIYLSAHGLSKQHGSSAAENEGDDPTFIHSRSLSRDAMSLAGFQENPSRLWVNHQNWRWRNLGRCTLELDLDVTVEDLPLRLAVSTATCPELDDTNDLPSLWGYWQLIESVKGSIGADRVVSGRGWLERAWGDLPLGQGPVVIDRFRISGRAEHWSESSQVTIDVLRTRRRDGSGQPQIAATLWHNGEKIELPAAELSMRDRDVWKSSQTGEQYFSGWEIRLPDPFNNAATEPLQLRLDVHNPDQEMELFGESRWSGLVNVAGAGNTVFSGFGFVELEPIGFDPASGAPR